MGKYVILIIALCAGVYANSISGEFVSDDIPVILENPQIGNFSAIHNPLDFVNYLCFKLGGLNPPVYHICNILLHAFTAVLLFLFLRGFFTPLASILAVIIFIVHPVQAEAVTWISGRPYILGTTFILLSFLLYSRSTDNEKLNLKLFSLSLGFMILGLGTRWYAIFYPGMIIICDLLYNKHKRRYKLWFAYALVALGWLAIKHLHVSQRLAYLQNDTGNSEFSNPLFNFAFSIFSHLKLIAWPRVLSLYHEPLVISATLLELQILALIIICCFLPYLFKKAKPVFFGLAIYVMFLMPTYSPVMISWLLAERYLYLPMAGLCLILGFTLDKLLIKPRLKKLTLIIFIVLSLCYCLRTVSRNRDWHTRASLWRSTVQASPLSPKAHNNMGDIYSIEGDKQKAAQSFKRAVELRPDYADAYHNLAHTYAAMGRTAEAIENYKKAIKFKPELYESYVNLGLLYYNTGKPSSARQYILRAYELRPSEELRQLLLRL